MQSVSPRQLESNDLNVCYIVVTDASLHFYYDSYTGFDEPCMFAGEVKNPKVSLQYCNSQRSITTLLLLFGGILLTSSILLFLAWRPNCNAGHRFFFHNCVLSRYMMMNCSYWTPIRMLTLTLKHRYLQTIALVCILTLSSPSFMAIYTFNGSLEHVKLTICIFLLLSCIFS